MVIVPVGRHGADTDRGRSARRRRIASRAARFLACLALAGLILGAGAGDAIAQLTSVRVTIKTSHVVNRGIDPNNPEVQFRLSVSEGNHYYSAITSKLCEQPECSHPFQGTSYVFRPLTPLSVYPHFCWYVIDDDGSSGEEILTSGAAKLPDDPTPRYVGVQSRSKFFYVSYQIDKNVQKDADWPPYCPTERIFAAPLPTPSTTTTITLSVTLPAGLDSVQLWEELGRGFAYQSYTYTPPPLATDAPNLDVVALAGLDSGESDLGTSLRWSWDSPTPGTHRFAYTVTTPASTALLRAPFASETRLWDATRTPAAVILGNFFPDSQVVIGGAWPDCNGNGLADHVEVLANPGLDCNGNLIPDTCDITDGTSSDCDNDGQPDDCAISAGSVADDDLDGVPDNCEVSGVDLAPETGGALGLSAWPNPFNPGVEIAFTAWRAGEIVVTVHDLQGREIARVFAGHVAAGPMRLAWDGRDEAGRTAPAGVYLVACRSGKGVSTAKLTLLK